MFWGRLKTVTKSKIGSTGFNLTKIDFTQPKFQTNVQFLFLLRIKYSCSDNTTPRNSKTKYYKELHLSRCNGGLSSGAASIFMREGRKSDIMDILYYHEL